MYNACLIGVTGFGRTHLDDLVAEVGRGEARLVAATVVNPREAKKECAILRELGCAVYSDYAAMLEERGSECDICFIPTGTHWHAPMTINALRHGTNVFVEKPAAATVQDIDAMKRAAEEAGRFVAVGFHGLYASETASMKRIILDGRLGRISSARFMAHWPRARSYYQRNDWAGRLRVGGAFALDSPINNAFAHQLNMVCFLAGREERASARLVSVEAELHRAHEIESADTACIRLETEEDVVLFGAASHCSQAFSDPEIIVEGEKGALHWTPERVALRTDGTVERVFTSDPHQAMRKAIMKRLRERLVHADARICDLDVARAQTLAVNGAHESSEIHPIPQHHVERVESDGEEFRVIPGVDGVIREAFERMLLFSELGAPWARSGRKVDLSRYERFDGGALGAPHCP